MKSILNTAKWAEASQPHLGCNMRNLGLNPNSKVVLQKERFIAQGLCVPRSAAVRTVEHN